VLLGCDDPARIAARQADQTGAVRLNPREVLCRVMVAQRPEVVRDLARRLGRDSDVVEAVPGCPKGIASKRRRALERELTRVTGCHAAPLMAELQGLSLGRIAA